MLNEGEEIRSSKRKVIRVESEETHDYVTEEKSTDYEEEDERGERSAKALISL